MTDTAWVSLAVIILASCGVIVYALYKNRSAFIKVPLPFAKQPLELSANDAKRIIALQNQGITPDMIDALKKYNNENKMPTSDQMLDIGNDILESLSEKALIEPETTDVTDPKQFKLGYVGWQILEGVLESQELFHPISWHDELTKNT